MATALIAGPLGCSELPGDCANYVDGSVLTA